MTKLFATFIKLCLLMKQYRWFFCFNERYVVCFIISIRNSNESVFMVKEVSGQLGFSFYTQENI